MTNSPATSVLAIFAHPDDIEFVAAGTMLMLRERGWDLHYLNLCTGNGGSLQLDGVTTASVRLKEAMEAARLLGAKFYPPISDDLELVYDQKALRKVAAVVREVRPSIVLTHALQDYMEDHMAAARIAVSAAFAHGVPNFRTDPPRAAFFQDVTVYHAMPHGQCDPLRQRVRGGLYVNTTPVQDLKRTALAAHASQRDWLDASQGMNSYLESMDEMARGVARLTEGFEYAEGWRRHLHVGLSANEVDPLRDCLGTESAVDVVYEAGLQRPV